MGQDRAVIIATFISVCLVTGFFGIVYWFANYNRLPEIRLTGDSQDNTVIPLQPVFLTNEGTTIQTYGMQIAPSSLS